MTSTVPQTGYAPVNGLQMYYEIHGTGQPLVLLHGAFMTIEGFAPLMESLAKDRQVIAVEQQAHGRTGDIDRPLTVEQMADDTAALLRHLGIENADIVGYSMGSAIAMFLTMQHPELVRKLVIAAASYNQDGLHPGILDGIQTITPEAFAGSPMEQAYLDVAPNPGDWPVLIEKIKQLDSDVPNLPPEAVQSLQAPTLVVVGDADIVRPEHAVEMFRLLGGGVAGDIEGLPPARLAVLPGTTHITLMERTDWLHSMITEFIDAPAPDAE